MEDEYLEFLEDISILKENHILMKGHERTQSKVFKKIADNFKKSLLKTQAVQEQFGGLEDSTKSETIENFVEA